jgi:membrane protein
MVVASGASSVRPAEGHPMDDVQTPTGALGQNAPRRGTATPALREVAGVLLRTYRGWRDHRVVRLGAGLAYYGLFTLVPLVTVMVIVAERLVSFEAAVTFIAEPLADLLGEEVEQVAATVGERVVQARSSATLGLFGIGALLVSASLLFVAFQDALNVIWEVPYRAGIQHTIRRRLLAFGVVLVTTGVVVVSLALQTVLAWVQRVLPSDYPTAIAGTVIVSRVVPVTVTAVALGLLFRLLAPAHVDLRAAVIGGAVTAIAMALAVAASGWWLARAAAPSVSGATSSFVVVLTAFYVQSQIVLAGAELTRAITLRAAPVAGDRARLGSGEVAR